MKFVVIFLQYIYIHVAMEKYLHSISLNPSYAPSYYNIGVMYPILSYPILSYPILSLTLPLGENSYSELGKYEEALNYYHQAIQHNPYYVESFCNCGVIYKNMGKLEEAISFYLKALAVNPNFVIARSNMAIALTDYGTKLKGEGKLKARPHSILSSIFFFNLIPIIVIVIMIIYLISYYYLSTSIEKEGIHQYKKALLHNYQYPDAHYNLGVAYGECLKHDRAIIYYELAIHFNPLCCEAFNNLGVIYKEQDNLEKAIQCYQAALTINPKFSQTLNNIGVVFTIQGKVNQIHMYRDIYMSISLSNIYIHSSIIRWMRRLLVLILPSKRTHLTRRPTTTWEFSIAMKGR